MTEQRAQGSFYEIGGEGFNDRRLLLLTSANKA